uniref:Uncharacterized protein n=1 Tax=Trichuris muris TaxID=70415 RepID=A0A5S6Q6R8_TRIMR
MELLDKLEARISRLEKLLQRRKTYKEQETHPSLLRSIAEVADKVSHAAANYKSINQAMGQLQSPLMLMIQNWGIQSMLSTKAKMELINLLEKKMENMAEQLADIERMSSVLDSEHIRNAPSLSDKADAVASSQRVVGFNILEYSSEAERIEHNYLAFVNVTSRCFVHWDEQIAKLEESRLTAPE